MVTCKKKTCRFPLQMILGPVKHITYSYGFRVFTRTMDSQSDGDLQGEIHCPGSSSTVEGHESGLECGGLTLGFWN